MSRSLEMLQEIARIGERTECDCEMLGSLLREAESVLTRNGFPSICLGVANIVDHLAVARLGEVYAVLGYRPDLTASEEPHRFHGAKRNGQPVA